MDDIDCVFVLDRMFTSTPRKVTSVQQVVKPKEKTLFD